jgi:hypothetical protein
MKLTLLYFVTRTIRGLFTTVRRNLMHIANVPVHIASNAKAATTSGFWADIRYGAGSKKSATINFVMT